MNPEYTKISYDEWFVQSHPNRTLGPVTNELFISYAYSEFQRFVGEDVSRTLDYNVDKENVLEVSFFVYKNNEVASDPPVMEKSDEYSVIAETVDDGERTVVVSQLINNKMVPYHHPVRVKITHLLLVDNVAMFEALVAAALVVIKITYDTQKNINDNSNK